MASSSWAQSAPRVPTRSTRRTARRTGNIFLAFAGDVAAYVSRTTGVDVSVAVPIGGNPNRIGFAARYENLGAYMEMLSQGADNWIAGSVHDEIWRTL